MLCPVWRQVFEVEDEQQQAAEPEPAPDIAVPPAAESGTGDPM
jgi:hypothetical protein